jgi:hypothetical protein
MDASMEFAPPLSGASPLFAALRAGMPHLEWRVPAAADAARWRVQRIGGRDYRVAQPVTFTPYASVRPCSARCRFCSETLRPHVGGTAAASLRPPPDYFAMLRQGLAQLSGLPLSHSLSGLEMTDDEAWFLQLLQTLGEAERDGLLVEQRVLYSNGAGFARSKGDALLDALQRFGLSWVELSRHHPQQAGNDAIMRFRDGEAIADAQVFVATAQRIAAALPLRLVCILQHGGIADADGVAGYLRWARQCGATTVIFREFSRLGDGYRTGGTQRYLAQARVGVEQVVAACMATPWWRTLRPLQITEGYYFWNLRMATAEGMEVVFETSDYAAMQARHDSGDIYKLVFFADGRLCAGWQPDRDLLWQARHG